jgi:hypothetical protein
MGRLAIIMWSLQFLSARLAGVARAKEAKAARIEKKIDALTVKSKSAIAQSIEAKSVRNVIGDTLL